MILSWINLLPTTKYSHTRSCWLSMRPTLTRLIRESNLTSTLVWGLLHEDRRHQLGAETELFHFSSGCGIAVNNGLRRGCIIIYDEPRGKIWRRLSRSVKIKLTWGPTNLRPTTWYRKFAIFLMRKNSSKTRSTLIIWLHVYFIRLSGTNGMNGINNCDISFTHFIHPVFHFWIVLLYTNYSHTSIQQERISRLIDFVIVLL